MTVLAARGLNFHTRTLGTGPPVVMLHGLLTGSIASWYFTVAPRLAERFTTFMVDLRGHGRSDRPIDGYGATSMAADVEALTDHLPPFSIVAHSYGCVVAARLAASAPDRVRALALVEPPFGLDIADLDIDEVTAPGVQMGARQAAKLRHLLTDTSILTDIAREPDLSTEEIAALPPHLLVAFGSASPCLVGRDTVAEARPDADVVVLPGDHDLHLTASEPLGAAIDRFLTAADDDTETDALTEPAEVQS